MKVTYISLSQIYPYIPIPDKFKGVLQTGRKNKVLGRWFKIWRKYICTDEKLIFFLSMVLAYPATLQILPCVSTVTRE